MTRPKKGTDQRRVIVDLSFPDGTAVNTGIDVSQYLGHDISYSLPTITDLISKLQIEGTGASIWKADLARSYRQLRSDPVDAPLLGIKHLGKVYLDRCPPFGCRSSSAACQRVANALVYIMAGNDHHCLAYLDDFSGCHASVTTAQAGFDAFVRLTDHLGLKLSHQKCTPPSTVVEWLGYKIDTNFMTISIPQQKMNEVIEECSKWLNRRQVKKSMVQSILGKLAHLAGCVQHGRKFLSRIIATLKQFGDNKWITVNDEFIKDIKWFYLYARSSNGINIYSTNRPTIVIECDSSLQGGGGVSRQYCYSWPYSYGFKERYSVIHQMEAINILVAYRTLAHVHDNNPASVLVLTDNIASSHALMTGRTRDPVLAACARELWLEAAKHQDIINIEHRPGTSIPLADALSRMDSNISKADYVRAAVIQHDLKFVPPVITDYVFFDSDL